MNNTKPSRGRGFTLIELLICVGIIGILTAIVIFKYKSFDSTILLKSAAYEVSLALRDTQVKSVSATRGNSNSFDYPYGITFTPNSKTYTGFQFTSTTVYPKYDGSVNAVDIGTVTFDKAIEISDVCVNGNDCSPTRLDISFKRPEFKAIFYVPGNSDPQNDAITDATIKVNSTTNPSNVFLIKVSKLGQISVEKQ